MKTLILTLIALIALAACNVSSDGESEGNITLEPSQIAANQFAPAAATDIPATAEAVILSAQGATVSETSEVTPEATMEPMPENTESPSVTTTDPTSEAAPDDPTSDPAADGSAAAPDILPTSNAASVQALAENPTQLLAIRMDSTCFVEGDPIPFRLEVTNLESAPVYFYTEGLWRLSINNSPVGPNLAEREPQVREDFVELPANQTYTREEEDLGLWVLSLGPDYISFSSPTGSGLRANEYWVSFLYTNVKDGLTEQPDGTFLIDRPAWRGTIVTSEIRFRVVEDPAQCEGA